MYVIAEGGRCPYLLRPVSGGCHRVELADGYEEHGDAERGPLKQGLEGVVTELGQRDDDGRSQKVKVALQRAGQKEWWYDRQALRVVRP